MIVLIKLILAHLLGDFVLQPDSWVKTKEAKNFRSYHLYIHSLIHGILAMLVIWDWNFWKWALMITCFHFVVDVLKVYLQTEKTERKLFFADQLAHLLLIYVVWHSYQDTGFATDFFTNLETMSLITALLLLTLPSSVLIKKFISKWTPEDGKNESLQKAGQYIGILERLFVFVFVVSNHWEAIGFLMAAKSVFRFGDLKESTDRKLTEYILIGTLVSFGLAILTGILYIQIIN